MNKESITGNKNTEKIAIAGKTFIFNMKVVSYIAFKTLPTVCGFKLDIVNNLKAQSLYKIK